jgi:hypothetical protein
MPELMLTLEGLRVQNETIMGNAHLRDNSQHWLFRSSL